MTTDAVLEMFGHLSLMVLVGFTCFWAGWKSASAYLNAARAVSEVSNAAVSQSNSYGATLDGVRSEMALLRGETEARRKSSEAHEKAVEESLLQLFQGLERAGLARSPRSVARQHGEAPGEA